MRLLSLLLAMVLTIGGLYLATVGGHSALDAFSAWSDSQQRMASGAMAVFTVFMLGIGGILRRLRSPRCSEISPAYEAATIVSLANSGRGRHALAPA